MMHNNVSVIFTASLLTGFIDLPSGYWIVERFFSFSDPFISGVL